MRIDFLSIFFVDTGEIIGILGDKPTLLKTRVSVKINEGRETDKRLIAQV